MEIKYGHTIISLYDSLQDLSAFRFHVYTMNLLIDADIGGDTSAIMRRLATILQKIDVDPEGAKQEVLNMSTAISNIENNISPEMRCFCAFIKSINGKAITEGDLNESGIDEIIELIRIKKVPMGVIWDALEFIKKKSRKSFRSFFRIGQTEVPRRRHLEG